MTHRLLNPPFAPYTLPHAFYGQVLIDGSPAPAGLQIQAIVEGGVQGPGNPIITNADGRFGGPRFWDYKMVVQGHIDEGAEIVFYVNGYRAASYPFHSATVTELSIDLRENDE